jgi:enoyl-CoA hydratase
MTTTLVNASKHDGVMVLELSNPPANTYSYDLMRALDAHVLDARMDKDVHVIVITGARPAAPEAGKKPATEFFCAGADIKMLEGADPYFKYDEAR